MLFSIRQIVHLAGTKGNCDWYEVLIFPLSSKQLFITWSIYFVGREIGRELLFEIPRSSVNGICIDICLDLLKSKGISS